MAILMKGSKGGDVKKLQGSLNKQKAKPPLAEDGIFGPKTHEAVKAFQKKVKQKPDGKAGELTLATLLAGGKLPEMKVEDYKNKTAKYKAYRAYNVEMHAGFMRIRKIADILENDFNEVIFAARDLSEANGKHWDKVFDLSEEIEWFQEKFETERLKNPKQAQKFADHCEKLDKTLKSIGKTQINPNVTKVNKIFSSLTKSVRSSLTKIDAEMKSLTKNDTDFKD